MSGAVSALEGRPGAKLFHRVGRGIALTEAGQVFLVEARAVLARAAVAELALAELAPGARALRVGGGPSLEAGLLVQTSLPLPERDFTAIRHTERYSSGMTDALLALMAGRYDPRPFGRRDRIVRAPVLDCGRQWRDGLAILRGHHDGRLSHPRG